MKFKTSFSILFAMMFFIVGTAYAQDDLYYNPDDEATESSYTEDYDEYTYYEDEVEDDDYEYYEDYEDYDYYYTTRIRRFRRPVYFGGFYSPFYTSARFYDPFAPFSVTVYDRWGYRNTYVNNYYFGAPGYSRWSRWNRWNNFNAWGPSYGWNSYSTVNNYYGGGFGGGFGGNAYNPYCPYPTTSAGAFRGNTFTTNNTTVTTPRRRANVVKTNVNASNRPGVKIGRGQSSQPTRTAVKQSTSRGTKKATRKSSSYRDRVKAKTATKTRKYSAPRKSSSSKSYQRSTPQRSTRSVRKSSSSSNRSYRSSSPRSSSSKSVRSSSSRSRRPR